MLAVCGAESPQKSVDNPPPLEMQSEQQAIKTAEEFIRENGYTDVPSSAIKKELDYESLEFAQNRDELLEFRFNTLVAKATSIRRSKSGWNVAFDYTGKRRDTCRVVTMNGDG